MRSARVAWITGIAAIAGFAAAQWLWPGRGASPGQDEASPSSAPAAAPSTPAPPTPGELRAEGGETIQIDSASLDPDRPVVLHLVLPAPSQTEAPRPVRIIAMDGSRSLEGEGILAADRTEARFEVDPAFLRPGRYIVEVHVTTLMPMSVRRYAVEVR